MDRTEDRSKEPKTKLVLDDGLAGTKGAGDTGGSTLGNRKHGIDDTLAGGQRLIRTQLPLIGSD